MFANCSVDDPPDSFYEFTADDYFRVARGWGANFATGPAASAPLKTGRVRAAEAAAAAAKIGPVPVRVLGFSEGMALQATFAATDPVSALQVGRVESLETSNNKQLETNTKKTHKQCAVAVHVS